MTKKLLLLHGALATRHQFDNLLPELNTYIQADAINFTGHGGLHIPIHGYSFKAFAHDILNYADTHGIERINLFGYSMGGYAAFYFARLFPDRVNRIMTLNVKFNWDPLTTARETALLDAEKLTTKVPGYANQLMMQHGVNVWKQVLSSTADMMQSLTRDILLTDTDFSQLNIPVLLSVGDRDTTASLQDTLRIYKLLKNAQLWVLPGTSHPLEQADDKALLHQLIRFFTD
ncbi:MAG: alpha/beta fold hydrolase [Bacteroidota bacterium]|jgi:pimeloyl-ACP methyl ester carboxylesterase